MTSFAFNSARLIAFLASALLLVGCGGGSSGSAKPQTQSSVTITGTVSKGPVGGATVRVYKLANGTKGELLNETTSSSNGSYLVGVLGYSGPVLVEATGGTYTDEVTKGDTPNGLLRAGFSVGTSETAVAAITALTEVAVRKAAGSLTETSLAIANSIVSQLVGNIDIVGTQPTDILNANSANASKAEKTYGLMLGAISHLANNVSPAPGMVSPLATATDIDTVLQEIAADLADNRADLTGANLNSALAAIVADTATNLTGATLDDIEADETITLAVTEAIVPEAEIPTVGTDTTHYKFAQVHEWFDQTFTSDRFAWGKNGDGTCSASGVENGWQRAGAALTVSAYPSAGPDAWATSDCTWSQSGNSLSGTIGADSYGPMAVSADGRYLGGAELDVTPVDGILTTRFGIKVNASGYTAAQLEGKTYRGVSLMRRFRDQNQDGSLFERLMYFYPEFEMTFKTLGVCSAQLGTTTATDEILHITRNPTSANVAQIDLLPNGFLIADEAVNASTNCTYTVSDAGLVTIPITFDNGASRIIKQQISADGKAMARSGSDSRFSPAGSAERQVKMEILTLVEDMSGWTPANSSYKIYATSAGADTGSQDLWLDVVDAAFTSDGNCTFAYDSASTELLFADGTILPGPGGDGSGTSQSCTWTVSNGLVTINFDFGLGPDSIQLQLADAGHLIIQREATLEATWYSQKFWMGFKIQ